MTATQQQQSDGQARPVQEGLFTWPSAAPQLIAARCSACREIVFPSQDSCPACTSRKVESVLLSREGTLWTFTVQHFPPPVPPYVGPADPATFQPLGIGYVELPEGIRVEGRLTEGDAAKLAIGMKMELVVVPFVRDASGTELLTFAFRPVDGAGAGAHA